MDPDDDSSEGDAASIDPELRRLLHAPPVEPEALLRHVQATRLDPGSVIDEMFVVQERLGQGGMGVVYRARHDALERDVAIKLCRRQATAFETARLRREAMSTAALAHPNIVVVHHVGTMDEQIYVVMELVGAGTFRQWLRARTRTWRQIVATLVEAAEGLAAAHAKGFVHRDFKPDNVLIGDDGRARVSDFGLAISVDEPRRGSTQRSDSTADHDPGPTSTMHHAGTPRYMAPEQHAGGPITAAADQFALCVVLYEALSGEHPFVGERSGPSAARRRDGLPRQVSRRVRRAIDRGLALDPSDRHSSVRALIERLTGELRWRSTVAMLSLGALGTTAAVLFARQGSPSVVCSEPVQPAPVWSQTDRQQLRTRFVQSTLGAGQQLATRVEGQLDAYLERWRRAEAGICRSTVDDPEGRAARHACLQVRAVEFDSLSGLLADGDPSVLARALSAVGRLSAPEDCVRHELPRLAREAPIDQSVLTEHLARASTALIALQLDRAMTHADAALAAAIDDRGRARARLARFRVLDKRNDYQDAGLEGERALQLAIRAGADDVAADAATLLVYTVGAGQGSPEKATRWADRAEAWLVRLGEPAMGRITLDTYRGLVLRESRRFDEAEALLRAALGAAQALKPPRPDMVARIRNNLASTLDRSGKREDAQTLLRQTLEQVERELGVDHPLRMTVLQTLSASLLRAGRLDEGLERAREVLAGYVTLYGPDGPRAAAAHANVGTLLLKQQRSEQGAHHLQIALSIYEREGDINAQQVVVRNLSQMAIVDRRHDDALALALRDVQLSRELGRKPNLAIALGNLGNIQSLRKEHEAAYATAQRMAEVAREAYDPDDPQRVFTWALLGNTAREVGELDASREAFERALKHLAATSGTAHPMVSYLEVGLAYTHARAGRDSEAVALLEAVDLQRIELDVDRYAAAHALASSRSILGDHTGARDDAARALVFAEASGDADSIAEATALARRLAVSTVAR